MLFSLLKSILSPLKLILAIIIVSVGFFMGGLFSYRTVEKETENLKMLSCANYLFAGVHNNVFDVNRNYIFDNLYLYPSFSFKVGLKDADGYRYFNTDVAIELNKVNYTSSNYVNENNIEVGEYARLGDNEVAVSANIATTYQLGVGSELVIDYGENKRVLTVKYIYFASYGFMDINTAKGLGTVLVGEYYAYLADLPSAKYLHFADNNSVVYSRLEYRRSEQARAVGHIILYYLGAIGIAALFCYAQEILLSKSRLARIKKLSVYGATQGRLIGYAAVKTLVIWVPSVAVATACIMPFFSGGLLPIVVAAVTSFVACFVSDIIRIRHEES